MEKLKSYKDFIRESKRLTEKQINIVQSKISDEYSKNFWTLALKSKVFTTEEKTFIRENLINVEINLNLITEKNLFGYLRDAGAYLKGLGEKAWNWFSKKIDYIRKGITSLIRGVKSFFMKLFYSSIDKIWSISQKSVDTSKMDALVEEASKQDEKKLAGELWAIEDMIKWWTSSKTSEKELNKINAELEKGVKNAEDTSEDALQQAQKELDEDNESTEEGGKKENEGVDILNTFYSYQMIAEGGGEKKSYMTIFLNFVSDIFGGKDLPEKDKDGNPVKLSKKLMWFMKLIFRIFIQILSPVTLLIKAYTKTLGKFVMNGFSYLSSLFGYMRKQIPTYDEITRADAKVSENFNSQYKGFEKINEGAAFEMKEFGGLKFVDLSIVSGIVATVFGLSADFFSTTGYGIKIFQGKPGGVFYFMTSEESVGGWLTGMKDVAAESFKKLWKVVWSWAFEHAPGLDNIKYIFKFVISFISLALMFKTLRKKVLAVGQYGKKKLNKQTNQKADDVTKSAEENEEQKNKTQQEQKELK
jgi:hypothetical protein